MSRHSNAASTRPAADFPSPLTFAADPRMREKVLAYALSFAQQHLKLGRTDTADTLLTAYCRARADSSLPVDRRPSRSARKRLNSNPIGPIRISIPRLGSRVEIQVSAEYHKRKSR